MWAVPWRSVWWNRGIKPVWLEIIQDGKLQEMTNAYNEHEDMEPVRYLPE